MDFYDFCILNNIRVIYYNFPCKIRGLCYRDQDWTIIAINPKLSGSVQKQALEHELIHVLNDHLNLPKEERDQCEKFVHEIMQKKKLDLPV